MPIPDFNGNTFVAFTDISGFKQMMKKQQAAVTALNHFYNSGYRILRAQQAVHGAFISDCAVLFVNNYQSEVNSLSALLHVVEELNREMLNHNVMLTTSIAHGQFSYHQRLEFPGIEKNPIYGNAYVAAFLDNESGTPAIQPGQCRILKSTDWTVQVQEPRLVDKGKHVLFHWMVQDRSEIGRFNEIYDDAYEQKYRGMLEALKKAANQAL